MWIRVYFSEFERAEIDLNLKKIYSYLHSDGNTDIIKFLNVDAIDYCTFGKELERTREFEREREIEFSFGEATTRTRNSDEIL